MQIEQLEINRIEAVVQLSMRAWAPVFTSIENAMHPELYRRSYPDGWEASQGQLVEDVCGSNDFEVWTANDGHETLGFVAIKMDAVSKTGEIYLIAVDPAFQGNGIAAKLTEFAVEWMKTEGMQVAMVETGADPGHEAARRTYEKAGFHPWPAVKYFRFL